MLFRPYAGVRATARKFLDLNFGRRPFLSYIEFHLTDHCNLNCKGCSHFSPIASEFYADLEQYKIDMQRLRRLFRNIKIIRLMGGEPLLHPDPASFIIATKSSFPKANINFVTNGILLFKAPAAFWEACRSTNASIRVSGYPLKGNSIDDKKLQIKANSECVPVAYDYNPGKKFAKPLTLSGDANKQKIFKECQNRSSCKHTCMNLKQGRIYHCPITAYVHYFNNKFNYRISQDAGINIHSQDVTGSLILKRLNKPIETCKWCSFTNFIEVPWSAGKTDSTTAFDWGT